MVLLMALDAVPGEAGWSSPQAEEAFAQAAKRLQALGMPQAEIEETLRQLYAATGEDIRATLQRATTMRW